VLDQLTRLLHSQSFHNSTVLQAFLRFVTEETIGGRSSEVNEYTIATRALGRGPDFDSASDTIVRTQAYRLRQKLHEYYSGEGKKDVLVIEIPKGHYVPAFRSRLTNEYPEPVVAASPDRVASEPAIPEAARTLPKSGAIVVLLVCAFAFGLLFGRKLSSRASDEAGPAAATAVDSFWRSFLQSDKEPIVAYTNALLLAAGPGDLFAFPGGPVGERGTLVSPGTIGSLAKQRAAPIRGPLYFEDSFTGVGDVLAAIDVSTALVHAGGQPSFKRGRLLTTYDLESHNVVFIGSPFVNEILNELPEQLKFVFTRKPYIWASAIDDLGVEKGTSHRYTVERSPDNGIILADYAVISCFRSLKPGRSILVFAGLTTSGTAAAARFASSPDGIAEMSRRLHRPSSGQPPWPGYFEFLLRAQLSHGLDVVRSECVASHSNWDEAAQHRQ
jgi:hypothetical protein